MHSSNPILTRNPSAVNFTGDRVTLDSVIVRSAMMFGVLTVSAAAAWLLNVPLGFGLIAGLVAFVIAMVASFKRTTSPALFLAYAALEGIVIGVISRHYESQYSGIVIQAILGVTIVFGTMLLMYKSRIIRATQRFTKILLIAAFSYLGLMIVNLVASLFVDGGLGLRDGGPLAIFASIAGVVIGALFYVLDFDQVERMIAQGAPEKESWRAAFGLTLTTVWIYLEILRLLSYFRD